MHIKIKIIKINKIKSKMFYRNRMPLQPGSQGLITPVGEIVHILRQLQALPEASSNLSTLT